jgi:hypothetical protein
MIFVTWEYCIIDSQILGCAKIDRIISITIAFFRLDVVLSLPFSNIVYPCFHCKLETKFL